MGNAEPLVVGVDGGGTSTRCLVATLSGEIVARGRAGGANPRSARDPGGNLTRALGEALFQLGPGFQPSDVAGGVFGLAGASAAGRERALAMAASAWHAAALPGLPVVVPDILVAFAAATPGPSGSVMIAGTGAVAARVADRLIVRRCDGYGWLLGDEGSGVWIGREAVRSALAALDGRGPQTALTGRVLPALTGNRPDSGAALGWDRPGSGAAPAGDRPESGAALLGNPPGSGAASLTGEALAQAIVAAVYDGEPARLGTLSPLVESAAREGDRVAITILDDAARLLVRTLDTVSAGAGLPVVLAGSLLTRPTLVAERVREALTGRTVVVAEDGAAGAAALAVRVAAGSAGGLRAARDTETEAAHRRLLAAGAA
ncbi:BadF/BadG/BcrA/BcrD ATPase family protein [Sphaerisporangium sp. NPDC088356]|uniref:N-acetylglucosamine kinase n=1 Tax=Sphaerisporangium sp. NPDC088356 TaxID=3154871 RepID=UPI0034320938